ncbi:hypothetical protein [Paramicrobacterium agarici]|uniref:Uncharacterized protein n=1 Tax=Paramicrobacterium agarici TaxID=630514 RepID=A0A2A9DYS7_9MICO|nr:hypothetical protein [Microbacterium agarici]PFG31285.1 hypothetical protein ATJ78_2246 [Microbacterium agarici]TQO24387.1 hypothetical protein FB385_3272 [Microbacterium agarici]
MTRLSSSYRTTETDQITQDAEDVTAAREMIEKAVPDGFEIIQLDIGKTEEGARVTGIIRSTTITPIEASGPDYPSALEALRAQVPDGCVSTGILIVEE